MASLSAEAVPDEQITLPPKFMTLHIMFSADINEQADKVHKKTYKSTVQSRSFEPKTTWSGNPKTLSYQLLKGLARQNWHLCDAQDVSLYYRVAAEHRDEEEQDDGKRIIQNAEDYETMVEYIKQRDYPLISVVAVVHSKMTNRIKLKQQAHEQIKQKLTKAKIWVAFKCQDETAAEPVYECKGCKKIVFKSRLDDKDRLSIRNFKRHVADCAKGKALVPDTIAKAAKKERTEEKAIRKESSVVYRKNLKEKDQKQSVAMTSRSVLDMFCPVPGNPNADRQKTNQALLDDQAEAKTILEAAAAIEEEEPEAKTILEAAAAIEEEEEKNEEPAQKMRKVALSFKL
eukprot:gene24975-1630_t